MRSKLFVSYTYLKDKSIEFDTLNQQQVKTYGRIGNMGISVVAILL